MNPIELQNAIKKNESSFVDHEIRRAANELMEIRTSPDTKYGGKSKKSRKSKKSKKSNKSKKSTKSNKSRKSKK